jgi:restriction system protein
MGDDDMSSLLSRKEKILLRKSFKYGSKFIIWSLSVVFTIVTTILLTGFELVIKCFKWYKHYKYFKNTNLSVPKIYKLINNMSGREFEFFLYYLFGANGYIVDIIEAVADGGKDLIIYDKNKGTTYVEAKRWNDDWRAGRPELQKLVGASVGDNIPNSLFITTGNYTNEAIDYARKVNNLELWDMNDIMKFIYKTPSQKLQRVFANTLSFNDSIENSWIKKLNNLSETLD